MKLEPYIFFYGRCEEALAFYKQVLGGSYELTRVGDSPMREHVPPQGHNMVMHATFTAPGLTFMASDGREVKTVNPDEGNVSLCIASEDGAEAERVFGALSAGGKVVMPYSDAFWGGRFGVLHDKFGVEWFVQGP
jgi:PhnB protein